MAPANTVRLMRWVRFGAAPETSCSLACDTMGWPWSSVRPAMVWHRAHWLLKIASPAAASGSVALAAGLVLVGHPGVEVGLRRARSTRMRILAWASPQNSVHWP